MKAFLPILLSIVFASTAFSKTEESLRLLTYNIHAGIGTDDLFDLKRIADVTLSTNAHVVALQEVDKQTRRSRGIDIAKRLGELTGMTPVFGASIPFAGGEYGNAILTKLEIEKTETVALPEIIPIEKRSALIAELRFANTTLQVLATHLCHRKEVNRIASVEALTRMQAPLATTSIVMGDLNAVPESKPLAILAEAGWKNPSTSPYLTSPSINPTRQIDYVLYRPGLSTKLEVTEIQVIPETEASDHRPLLVSFKFEE